MSQIWLDWIGGANAAQACQREVVVKHQSLLWVVETLDILEKKQFKPLEMSYEGAL